MRALVTGSSGFLGKALCKELIDSGYEVFGVDWNFYKEDWNDGVIKTFANIESNKLTYDGEFDYIFHLASPCSIIQYQREEYCHEQAITGFSLINQFARTNKVPLIVPSTGSLSADHLNEYAKTKLFFEQSLLPTDYCFRLFACYGDEKRKGDYASVIYQFCKLAKEGKEIVVYGNGEQKRDFIFVDDAVRKMIDNIEGEIHRGEIASGIQCSFNEVLSTIEGLLGHELNVRYLEKPEGYLNETKSTCKVDKKATTLKEGIKFILSTL